MNETDYQPEPLPRRTPFEAMAAGGMPPAQPPENHRTDPMAAMIAHGALPVQPPRDRRAYQSPGAPPWSNGRRRTAPWVIAVTVLGSLALCIAGCLGTGLVLSAGPVPAQSILASPSPAAVNTSGTCEKRIVGEYGLVATVRATNASEHNQSGTIWVRWPITGEAAQEFTKRVTLAPGDSAELLVNEEVMAERWLRMGECSYGWTFGNRPTPTPSD